MLDPNPNEHAAARGGDANVSETNEITATVNPAPAPAPAAVETGFGDLGGTPAPVQQATPTVNAVADTGEPKDPDVDLDARVAGLLANSPATNWNTVCIFMAAVVPWPASPQDP